LIIEIHKKKKKNYPHLSTSFGGSPDFEFSAHVRAYVSKQASQISGKA
jgi:hypothetical protein